MCAPPPDLDVVELCSRLVAAGLTDGRLGRLVGRQASTMWRLRHGRIRDPEYRVVAVLIGLHAAVCCHLPLPRRAAPDAPVVAQETMRLS